MRSEIRYELPIYSSTLEKDPIVERKNMDMRIELIGEDAAKITRKISIWFNTVICNTYTIVDFVPKLYDAYDKIVELVDSKWLQELQYINREEFEYWQPKHYILYLDDIGMFQFIARGYKVTENE